MSKSSTATLPKTQLTSAWSKGPPPNTSTTSSRSQSPAPSGAPTPVHQSHSRRPSTLGGQAVPIKDGVSIPRNNVNHVKSGSSVTFGSIDDASATISSSPSATPAAIKAADSVKSFGSLPVGPTVVNGKPPIKSSQSTSASSSTAPKFDVRKLFQTPSSTSPSPQPPSDTSSPSLRTSSLPPIQPSQGQQTPPTAYTNFVPPNGMRNQNGPNQPPRSPAFQRQHLSNGNAQRPPGNVNGPQMSPNLAHARPTNPAVSAPPPGSMQQQQQMQPVMWPYYYHSMPDYMNGYPNGWYVQQQMQPGAPQPPHPHNGMPMSPRNAPVPLQAPGTPTQAPAIPTNHPPHLPPLSHSANNSMSGIGSPPPTPSSAISGSTRLNNNAPSFIPTQQRSAKITFKNADGIEVDVASLRSVQVTPSLTSPPPSTTPLTASPNRRVRMEKPEDKEKRLAAEQAEKEKVRKAEAEAAAKKEQEKKEKEVKEKEEREAKEKEAKEKIEREEAEKKKQEEEAKERLRKEEEERVRLEEERLAKEQAEKQKKEEEEKAEQERIRKEEELAKAEAEAKVSKEAAEAAKRELPVAEPQLVAAEVEEGEIVEDPEDIVKPKPKEPLHIDIGTLEPLRRRPGPLDLSNTVKATVSQPLPSALATARIIEDIQSVQYPQGILSPKVELNVNAVGSKFRYDREFLLQFMAICKDKPDMLPPLDAIGLEPADQASFAITRNPSRKGSNAMPNRASSAGYGAQSSFSKGGMGNFAIGGAVSKLSSEDRFAIANTGRAVSAGSSSAVPFPRPITRTSSQGGVGGSPSMRTRSKRGTQRPEPSKMQNNTQNHSSGYHGSSQSQMMNMEPVVPLQATANRWDRKSLAHGNTDSPEIVDRKVKGLLNKLTMEKFDSISDQIIEWANKSEKETDGRTLIQVIRLVFEKATDEAAWSEMYARLCRKMMERISPKVQDDDIKHHAGGQLFRKYLLNRCQEDFERGWVQKEATAAAAASKIMEDNAAKSKAEASKEGGEDEIALYSEEYYAAQKAKRQGLGLIKFIGELFKLSMLTERIMHECVKKLLGNVENPEEEEIESLCKLLSTVGSLLDTPKARGHMVVYFSRMKELTKSPNVSSRMHFMLQDVIELRERKWVNRKAEAAPATISQIHEAAAKEAAAKEKESFQRNISMSRGGSRRGGDRNNESQPGPDGWMPVANGPPRPPAKAGDLSKLGQLSKGVPMTFGPSSVFSKDKKESKRDSISRTSSSSNMFSMLSQNSESAAEGSSKGSRAPGRKPSEDVSSAAPEQRRRLVLAPRSKPVEEAESLQPAESEDSSDDEVVAVPSMSAAQAKKKIEEDMKELFSVRNLDEAEDYFTKLPSEYHHILVDKLISTAIESKASDAQLVSGLLTRASEKSLCSLEAFEEAFGNVIELLDDIAIDAPKAPELMALMMKGPGFDEATRAKLVSKSEFTGSKLLKLLS